MEKSEGLSFLIAFMHRSVNIKNHKPPKIATGTLKSTENELVLTNEQETLSLRSHNDPWVGGAKWL